MTSFQIESSLQAKQFLSEIKNQLQEMVRILNVQENILATVTVVSKHLRTGLKMHLLAI